MPMRLREKGQVTIPRNIRNALHLDKEAILWAAKVGDSILLSTQPSQFETVASAFVKEAKKKGISLEELLLDLRKTRRA